MEIGKELGEVLARIRKGLAETRDGASGVVDLVKIGTIEASDNALDETKKSVAKVKETLAEAWTKAEKEAAETKVLAKEYLDKAGKAVAAAEKELSEAADKIKAKSVEGTEEAIAKAKRALEEAEEFDLQNQVESKGNKYWRLSIAPDAQLPFSTLSWQGGRPHIIILMVGGK